MKLSWSIVNIYLSWSISLTMILLMDKILHQLIIWFIPLFIGFPITQVVQDFVHQQWPCWRRCVPVLFCWNQAVLDLAERPTAMLFKRVEGGHRGCGWRSWSASLGAKGVPLGTGGILDWWICVPIMLHDNWWYIDGYGTYHRPSKVTINWYWPTQGTCDEKW